MQWTTSRRRTAALLGLLPALAACGAQANTRPQPADAVTRHVVLISIDGLRADAIQAAGAANLQRMMHEGAYSLKARTIMPSRTLPSHTSMLTGVPPEVHGITFNDERVQLEGHVGVPTVFDVADKDGLFTAAFFGKSKFRHLIHAGAPDDVEAPRGSELVLAPRMTQQVVEYLRFRRPDFLFVHLPDPDIAGHSVGWMSLPYRWAVRRADAAVEQIRRAAVRAFGDDVVVIVTADHGGHGKDHGTDAPEDVTIPWIAWGAPVRTGEIQAQIRTFDSAATVLWLLGVDVPPDWAGRPVTSAFDAPAIAPADSARADTATRPAA